jgi:glycine/D-amino acid oxidase-like deaminating enzyme
MQDGGADDFAVKLASYWLDTATPAGDLSGGEPPARADVVVVGGGLTGLSTALHLARQGADVVVCEANTVGWGASGRNGGMATPGLAIGFATAVRRYGADRAAAMFQAYNEAIGTVEEVVAAEGIDCAFTRPGRLSLAYRPAHYAAFERAAEQLRSLAGQDVRLVPKARLSEEIGSPYYHGALVDPLGAAVHPGRLTAGLARAAVRRGAAIHERPLDEKTVDELLPHRRVASDSKHLLYYFRITPDNRLLFGGRARFARSGGKSDRTSGRILLRGMTRVFPRLADEPLAGPPFPRGARSRRATVVPATRWRLLQVPRPGELIA